MRADLEWFRTFKAVYEAGTMSDAARRLNIFQPGVSLHLSSLETFIGHPLFERNTRKMSPTVDARLLYRQVVEPLARLEEIENSFRKRPGENRVTLSVGMYPGLFHQLLEKHIPELGCNVIMHLESNEQLVAHLESGTVDLIVTTQNIPNHNVAYQMLGHSRFVLVAGGRTDLSEFPQPDGASKRRLETWLKSQLWYNTMYGIHLGNFWKLNFNHEPDFTPNYIIPDKYSILHCLKNGVGLAILPESLCRPAMDAGEIVKLWDGYAEMTNTLYLGQRKKTLLREAIQEVKDIILSEFGKSHKEDAATETL